MKQKLIALLSNLTFAVGCLAVAIYTRLRDVFTKKEVPMEFVTLLRQAIDAAKAGDYLCALKCGAKALTLALEAIHPDHPPVFQAVTPCADLEACCVELESHLPASEGPEAMQAFPWQTLIPVVLDFLKLLWERRQ